MFREKKLGIDFSKEIKITKEYYGSVKNHRS